MLWKNRWSSTNKAGAGPCICNALAMCEFLRSSPPPFSAKRQSLSLFDALFAALQTRKGATTSQVPQQLLEVMHNALV